MICTAWTTVDSARRTDHAAGQKNNALGEAMREANSATAERRGMLVSIAASTPSDSALP